MQHFTFKTTAVLALSSLCMTMLMQACGGSSDANAQAAAERDPIEGLWQSSVSLTDCTSGASVGGFRGLSTFSRGGIAVADNTTPPNTKGVALGTWRQTAPGAYVMEARFWRYLPDGTPAGQQRLTRTVTLASDGRSVSGTVVSITLDGADNPVRTVCGTETGARVGG
jgi:hypothetical protein